MNDESFWSHLWREIAASTALMLAFWGALGGATNALTTRMALREALRHVLLGGLIAAGMGSFSIVIVAGWLGLPDGAVAAGGYSWAPPLNGGFTVLELPPREAAVAWAARIARACRCDQELRLFGFDPQS